MDVAIGVDSHKSSLEIGALDGYGRIATTKRFRNDVVGLKEAVEWIGCHEGIKQIGIEGSAFYGAGLARALMAAGEQVREVPAFLTHRERKKAPSKGKSDSSDAIAIARVVVRGEGLVPVRVEDIYQDLKLLSDARDALVRERTQLINRIHADLAVLVPGYEARVPKLTARPTSPRPEGFCTEPRA